MSNHPLVLQRRGLSNDTDIYIFHPDATVENILSLRYASIPQPQRFYIFLDGLNVNHVRALIEILNVFARRNILWKIFELRVANVGSYELLRNLIQTAHSLEIGEKMVIHQGQIPPSIGNPQRPFLLSSVMENNRMKHLSMDITLPRYSLGDIQLLGEVLRTNQKLEGVSLRLADGDNIDFICNALAANTCLQQLQLDCNGVNTEALIAAILSSVQNHPTLRNIEMDAEEYGDLAFESIGNFIGFSTRIQEVVVRCSALEAPPLKVVPILRGLSQNDCMTKFHLEGFQTTSMSAVFQAAARRPKMNHVALLLHGTTEHELMELRDMNRLDHPVLLDLLKDTVRACESTLHQMLLEQPEIRFSDEDVRASSEDLRTICNLNYYGRYLLDRPTSAVPVGIWPWVLQRANENPDVILELLHGPAFCDRGS